jgi:cysteine synthase A
MKESILETVGQTPLVRLNRIFGDSDFQVIAKLEAFNPGGSSKDRPAFHIIKQALASGEIGPNTVVVESSSGNMAIGLAQACLYYGVPFICVVDVKTTQKNIEILEAYGAEIELVTQPDPVTGEYLAARINRVRSLVQSIGDVFWPNQYSNTNNANAQYRTAILIICSARSVLVGRLGDALITSTNIT